MMAVHADRSIAAAGIRDKVTIFFISLHPVEYFLNDKDRLSPLNWGVAGRI
jgi:hypothetical protein